jgi:hypothetical protein
VKAALNELLDGDGGEQDTESLLVSWSNVKYKPLGAFGDDVGIKGDIYVSDTQSLRVIPNTQLTRDYRNNVALNPFGGETFLDFGLRKANLNRLNVGTKVSILHDAPDFHLHEWHFSSNAVWNGEDLNNQILFTGSNVCFSQPVIVSAVSNGKNAAVTFGSDLVRVSLGCNQTSLSSQAWRFSSTASNVVHAEVDTTGSLYLNSNIRMSNVAIIRAINSAQEGKIEISPDAFRYYSSSNRIAFSVNSNGLFPLTQSKILGKIETIYTPDPRNPLSNLVASNFPRVEFSLADGLKYGYGLQYDLANLDVIKVTRDGELYTLNTSTSTLGKIVDTQARVCAPIQIGAFEVANDGSVAVGKLRILPTGKMLYDGQVLLSYAGRIPGHRVEFAGEFEAAATVRPVQVPQSTYTTNFLAY